MYCVTIYIVNTHTYQCIQYVLCDNVYCQYSYISMYTIHINAHMYYINIYLHNDISQGGREIYTPNHPAAKQAHLQEQAIKTMGWLRLVGSLKL